MDNEYPPEEEHDRRIEELRVRLQGEDKMISVWDGYGFAPVQQLCLGSYKVIQQRHFGIESFVLYNNDSVIGEDIPSQTTRFNSANWNIIERILGTPLKCQRCGNILPPRIV